MVGMTQELAFGGAGYHYFCDESCRAQHLLSLSISRAVRLIPEDSFQPVLLYLVPQGIATDAEQLCSFSFVAIGELKGLLQELFLDLFQIRPFLRQAHQGTAPRHR